jgi:phosphatidylserine/phosphatidylglycerophosphate/cardiolipin synthase-like enzyme
MTANLTTPSLDKNTELGIYLNDEDAVQLDKLFDMIFQKGTQYRHYISTLKDKSLIVQTETTLKDTDINKIKKTTGIRYTYTDLNESLYLQILEIIKKAREFVYLSSYCIIELDTLFEFKQEIESAINRGVRVVIFCRGMNYRYDHMVACDWLKKTGCVIYADVYNHSKGIASENAGLIFTANIDGKHGLKNGFEVGCILNDEQRALFIKLHDYLVDTSDYTFQLGALRQDFFDTYTSYQKEKGTDAPKFPDELLINFRDNDLVTDNELYEFPLFYASDGTDKFLIAGDSLYKCSYDNGTFIILAKEKMNYTLEKYVLTYKKLIFR